MEKAKPDRFDETGVRQLSCQRRPEGDVRENVSLWSMRATLRLGPRDNRAHASLNVCSVGTGNSAGDGFSRRPRSVPGNGDQIGRQHALLNGWRPDRHRPYRNDLVDTGGNRRWSSRVPVFGGFADNPTLANDCRLLSEPLS